jgi:hypothetical protein
MRGNLEGPSSTSKLEELFKIPLAGLFFRLSVGSELLPAITVSLIAALLILFEFG